MLQITNLSKKFGNHEVLKDVSITVNKGEVVSVLGSSGSGKTTLLRCAAFLERADKGRISFGDIEFDMYKANHQDVKTIRRKMGFVFQNFNLFLNKTAKENITEGLIYGYGYDKKDAEEIALASLEKVGLSDRVNYYPAKLSGGQQQRVAIARALSANPDIVLLDEPTSALDPELTGEVLDTIQKLAKDGTTMLLVTHEIAFARDVSNKIIFMDEGVVFEENNAKDFFENPKKDRTKQFLSRYR